MRVEIDLAYAIKKLTLAPPFLELKWLFSDPCAGSQYTRTVSATLLAMEIFLQILTPLLSQICC